MRTGFPDLELRQHWPVDAKRQKREDFYRPAGEQPGLLHNIGDDYERWRSKLLWRSRSAGFSVPLTNTLQSILGVANAEAQIAKLYTSLRCMDSERIDRLAQQGALLQVPDLFAALTHKHVGSLSAALQ